MEYRWRYQDAQGRDVTGPDVMFADQTQAEEWFGDRWRDLLDAGVEQVTLLRSESEVYGPMSLHPAS
ncbi:hypothetical protein V1227_19140 [Lentzea sp. DG1S-22]|uniref:hypothetical protein n=1 Tax=unclassified Lentzea TaxID=2643253 RepID=UPI001F3299E5|nr:MULTISPECIES: hypothetical protein [unclassified Lentzea]MCG8926686.1 hypothetical protein [Lentzea sp. CC55]WVH84762.1 hypothetical protein V1227_19140 [Lentzea sp. DG1S-22]